MLTIFFVSSISHSSIANTLSLEEFSQSAQWQKLLTYKVNEKNQRYITNKDFLLSTQREQTPLHELQATIAAFYKPITDDSQINQHAQCQFPARLILIARHVDLNRFGALPNTDCQTYKQWRQDINASSISVVFASGYMSNPASMYGHLFLKINKPHEQKNNLLNASLNYGAIVPNDENPITYILRGIFGGYDAGYSDQQFYRHQHNYGNVELRDLWEYKLALTSEDVNLLVAHIWELLGNKFEYYFIDENCAFHIAKLIEVVLDKPLISNDSLWVIPSSVAKGLKKASYLNKPLLAQVRYIPSSESILHNYYKQLTSQQRGTAKALINNNFNFKHSAYQQLTITEKQIIIEALLQYLSVMKQKQPDDKLNIKNKKKLMKERFKLPIGKSITTQFSVKKPAPHLGMKPSKYSMGFASVHQQKQYFTAGFRMNYFDDLSVDIAKQTFANLEMVDIEFILNDKEAHLAKIDLVNINSLYLPAIPWSNTLESAWAVRVGYEQLNNNCFDCGVFFAEGDIGKSTLLNKDSLVYAMMGGKLFFGKEDDINVSAKIGMISSLSKHLKIKIELQKISDISFSNASENRWYGELNYQFAQDWELRLLAEKQHSTFFGLKVNYFWDF
ncbi:MAG: DUF4105 domain-containing protein [Litorilituus sp.]|jgi:hypothetical protein|nr:DUF4105 domain-containing protein [Litorilituus sp.]